MKFELKFNMDGAAFETDWRTEIQAILHDVSEALEDGDDCISTNIIDSNGNTVGRFTVTN